MAGLTLEVSELSAYNVNNFGSPFLFLQPYIYNVCGQYYNVASLNFGTRSRGSGLRHSSAAILTLLSASGCRYATILAASHLRLSHSLPGVACIPQGSGEFYCFTALYQLQRLTPNRC